LVSTLLIDDDSLTFLHSHLVQESNCSEVFDYLRELYDLPERPAIDCEGQPTVAAEDAGDEAVKDEL
jgi:hypothetical protein